MPWAVGSWRRCSEASEEISSSSWFKHTSFSQIPTLSRVFCGKPGFPWQIPHILKQEGIWSRGYLLFNPVGFGENLSQLVFFWGGRGWGALSKWKMSSGAHRWAASGYSFVELEPPQQWLVDLIPHVSDSGGTFPILSWHPSGETAGF